MFNNGNYIRDFTFVDDVAKIMALFIKKMKQRIKFLIFAPLNL